ncbi:hypothetical protein ABFY60_28035 [Lysinibacillus pakistanensis]
MTEIKVRVDLAMKKKITSIAKKKKMTQNALYEPSFGGMCAHSRCLPFF